MRKEVELWEFIVERLGRNESVVLMVVAESTGSSPGRAGFKMAVSADGMCGSIGGGVMEVALVEKARTILGTGSIPDSQPIRQVHRKNSEHESGMICSGEQTVILQRLEAGELGIVRQILDAYEKDGFVLSLTSESIDVADSVEQRGFELIEGGSYIYTEGIGRENHLYIVGGGHCALALSEIVSKLGFRIRVFDDRPNLNTLEKNEFADDVFILESYEAIGDMVPAGETSFVVVMTLGYKYDKLVIKKLLSKDVKYFGVLGSDAKMALLIKELVDEGFDRTRLEAIHTPIGIDINSRSPAEIAISIAAQIISVKNGGGVR